MSLKKRAVRVHQIPENISAAEAAHFLMDLRQYVETERPRFVLDCSNIVEMNQRNIFLLLSCLEEAMKCNGDVRLASLSPLAEEVLRDAGVSRLFEMFVNPEVAVQSFHQRATSMAPMAERSGSYLHPNVHAA